MKKIYVAIACALVGSAAIAQHSQMPAISAPVNNGTLNTSYQPHTGTRAGLWMNYALELDDPNTGWTPGMAAYEFFPIMPDSNLIWGLDQSNNPVYVPYHMAATMLDPKNTPNGTTNGFNTTQNYTLDSIEIVYAYLRSLSVTDTLQVQIIKHDVSLEWTLSSSNMTYQDITYVSANNNITQSQVLATYNVLLGDADSSNAARSMLLATPGVPSQNGQNRIGVVLKFKPGFTYSLGDSLFSKNPFFILSAEQNGANTDPTYYGTPNVSTSDMNCSYVLPSDVRYDFNANGWNGYFIPTWAWTTGYAYEHHVISFLINQAVGVNENSAVVAMGDIYPNPTSGVSTIDYAVQTEADVTIEITDVTGKVILAQREGNKPAGAYKANLDLQNLAAGTYFAAIRANGAKQVKRLVVAK